VDWAQHFVEQYGYWAVFVWTFIEGESVFVAAAALAAAGILAPWKVIVVAAAGAFVGHLVFFALGRWKGMQVIEAVPFLKRHYPKANVILDKYAQWSIFIFQYLYGTRIAAAILFGASSIGFWRFLVLQILNCLSWSLIIYAVGHALGLAGLAILHRFGLAGLIIAIVAALAIGGGIYFRFGHHHVRNHFNNIKNSKQDDDTT